MATTPQPQNPGAESAGNDTAKPEDGTPAAGIPTTAPRPAEIGGPPGPEPTRYGDWQFNGRVTDF